MYYNDILTCRRILFEIVATGIHAQQNMTTSTTDEDEYHTTHPTKEASLPSQIYEGKNDDASQETRQTNEGTQVTYFMNSAEYNGLYNEGAMENNYNVNFETTEDNLHGGNDTQRELKTFYVVSSHFSCSETPKETGRRRGKPEGSK